MAFGFVPGIISFGNEVPTPSGYIREIIIPINTASATDLINYPLYIKIQSSSLRLVADGGKVLSSSGNDILFYQDYGLNTLLEWDFTYWNKITGEIVAWVKIPSLSHTATTSIYINYGNTNIDLNNYYSNRASVWLGYKTVGHLSSGTREFYNSVNNSEMLHYGTGMTNTALSDLPYGLNMGSTDINYIDTNHKLSNSFTYSFFYKVITQLTGMEVAGGYSLVSLSGTGVSLFNDGNNNTLYYFADADSKKNTDSDFLNQPVFVTIQFDSSGGLMTFFKNGSLTSVLNSVTVDGSNNFLIGKFDGSNQNFQGVISNFKIHGGLRTQDDISTEYFSIKNMYKGITLGTELPYITGYKHYVELTYLNPSTATDFPIYVNLKFDSLKHVSNGGYVQNINGYDIMFFADTLSKEPLQYEIESYDPTTGSVVAHVKIPTLVYPSASYKFYMTFGYNNISLKPNLPKKTWRSAYKAVYNFSNNHDSTTNTSDSTSNINNLIPTDASSSVYLDDDVALSIDEPISTLTPVLTNVNDITIYGWFNFNDITNPYQTLFYVGDLSSPNGYGLMLNANNDGDGTLYFVADGVYYSTNYQVTQNVFKPYYLIITNNIAYVYQGGLNLIGTIQNFTASTPTNFTTIGYSYINQQNYLLSGSINRLRFVDQAMTQNELANEWLAQNITRSSVLTATGITAGYSFFFDPGNINSYNDPDIHLNDLSIYESTGFTVNSPTYSQDGGGSLNFDATNYGYFSATSTNCFDLSGVDGYAIESWVKFDTFVNHNNNGQTPFAKGQYNVNWDWGINVVSSTSIIFYTAGTAKSYTVTLSNALQTNTWYHIVVTGDNDLISKMYINGVLVGSYNGQLSFSITNFEPNRIEIGGYGWAPGGIPESSTNGDPTTYGKLLGNLGVCRTYKSMLDSNDVAINFISDKDRYGY